MSNQLGRFEILSELARSANGAVYKANDPESSQTVALKTLDLIKLGEQGPEIVKRVLEEGEASKTLNSHNLAVLYGAGDIGDQFCASLEYVQGNSIATMLARKEGFSIWDLQDIARQTCQGLDHAHTKGAFHYSLEPAKIMVTWDGTVKILGFGISTMGAFASQASGAAPQVLHYMSPEQLHGDPLDARSNLFSLGAILYEMVTERKAFDGDDAEQVRQQILEAQPVPPLQVNPKMHPALSGVIMKALSKAPENRYASGQDLVNDLEKCKESPGKAAAQKAAQPSQGLKAPQPAKPVARPAATPAKAAAPEIQKSPAEKPAWPVAQAAQAAARVQSSNQTKPASTPPTAAPEKAFAAAAGFGTATSESGRDSNIGAVHSFEVNTTKASYGMAEEQANLSAALIEPEPATETPKIHVDPMMAEPEEASGVKSRSFADVDELPPLKEAYVAPAPPPEPAPEPVPVSAATTFRAPVPEKPKVQPREVARKAVTEIKKTPPKLFAYSIAAAVGVILLIILGIAFHFRNESTDDDSTAEQAASIQSKPQTVPASTPAVQAPAAAPVPVQQVATAAPIEQAPAVSVKPRYSPRKKKEKTPPPAPVIVPGELMVSSTPAGAQLHFDGRTDPTWITPYNLTALNPGQHTVTISKPGFSTETRAIEVGSGSKSFVSVQLAALTATLSVTSTPSGAEIYLDGKDIAHATPAQISVENPGTHTVSVRKQGFLEESTTANLQTGQSFHYSPRLRALGNTEEIKTVSKFKKVFGGGDAAGMGTVSIKTNPKGAQIAVNRRILDKLTPLEFYLNPGNYVIDITASGYQDIHRVITVDKGGKVVIEENMQRE